MYWWFHVVLAIVLLIMPAKPSSRSQQPKVTPDKVADDKVADDKVADDKVVFSGSLSTETNNQQIPSEQPKDKDQWSPVNKSSCVLLSPVAVIKVKRLCGQALLICPDLGMTHIIIMSIDTFIVPSLLWVS